MNHGGFEPITFIVVGSGFTTVPLRQLVAYSTKYHYRWHVCDLIYESGPLFISVTVLHMRCTAFQCQQISMSMPADVSVPARTANQSRLLYIYSDHQIRDEIVNIVYISMEKV